MAREVETPLLFRFGASAIKQFKNGVNVYFDDPLLLILF